MGRRSLQLLLERIRQPGATDGPRHIMLPTTLITGDTTAPRPASAGDNQRIRRTRKSTAKA
jgi:hypothetical protein